MRHAEEPLVTGPDTGAYPSMSLWVEKLAIPNISNLIFGTGRVVVWGHILIKTGIDTHSSLRLPDKLDCY